MTYWNGEQTPARRVVVKVGPGTKSTYWHNGMEGTERHAVEVTYGGEVFFLDDEEGAGWAKVTDGKGSPRLGHRSLPADSTVVSERELI